MNDIKELAKLQKEHMQELRDWFDMEEQYRVDGVNISECLFYNFIQHLNQLIYDETFRSDEVQND